MDNRDPYLLRKTWTISEAATLMADEDPRRPNFSTKYESSTLAVVEAIRNKEVDGSIILRDSDSQEIDFERSTVSTKSLGTWLSKHEFNCVFLAEWMVTKCTIATNDVDEERLVVTNSLPLNQPPYLDHNHERYSAKLDAAVCAWMALEGVNLEGQIPSQVLQKWLIERAEQFDLLKKDGSPNRHAIDYIAKVANWKPEGGAPRTPGN